MEKVFGLNEFKPGWDQGMQPQETFRHVAKMLVDEGGIMHEPGTHRVPRDGFRERQQGKLKDPKKPEWIEPKTFVEQLEQG